MVRVVVADNRYIAATYALPITAFRAVAQFAIAIVTIYITSIDRYSLATAQSAGIWDIFADEQSKNRPASEAGDSDNGADPDRGTQYESCHSQPRCEPKEEPGTDILGGLDAITACRHQGY